MKRGTQVIAIPPGETIREQLNEIGMKQKEFAIRMGMSEKHISKLINGEVQLTIETARRLEMVLGAPTQFWCNLESLYREDILKVAEEESMMEDILLADNMPYKEMVQVGWTVETNKKTEQVLRLRKYFEIAELKYLETTLMPRIACRSLCKKEKDDCSLLVWAQKARSEARSIQTKPINIERLRKNIPNFQKMLGLSYETNIDELKRVLADCGVALVLLDNMNKTFLRGVTFLDGNKIVLGISERDTAENEFFINLFHEIAHILFGHIEKTGGISEEDETCAENYAREMVNVLERS